MLSGGVGFSATPDDVARRVRKRDDDVATQPRSRRPTCCTCDGTVSDCTLTVRVNRC